MTGIPLVQDNRRVGFACGPSDDDFKPQNTMRRKWCFRCRARQPHWLTIIDQMWYDPEPIWICERCGGDHTSFPS